MAFTNGSTFIGLTDEEYQILKADGEYTDILRYFTIEETIGGVPYHLAPSGLFDNMLWQNVIQNDDTEINGVGTWTVTLDPAVYYSAFGFALQ